MTPGDVIAGKYRVLRRLGQGGMGLVLLAEHVHLGEHVAIKIMARAGSNTSEASTRFLREARAAAKLKGEHIARATDFGTLDSGAPYIVLEYVEGEDLGAHLRRSGRIVTPEAVGYVLQACEGIAEAHAAGIVHRDLKPANLFLCKRPDGSPLIKVLDFGVAKSTQPLSGETSGLTGTGAMMGSPIYMSPEQLKSSKDVGPTSDVWSLCVVLFELLTGRQPFDGETFPAIAGAILYVPSPDPCAERQAIPRALGDAVLKGLMKDPAQRFQSVGELARALAPFANDDAQVHAGRASRILRESTSNVPDSPSFASASDGRQSAAPSASGFRPSSAPAFLAQGAHGLGPQTGLKQPHSASPFPAHGMQGMQGPPGAPAFGPSTSPAAQSVYMNPPAVHASSVGAPGSPSFDGASTTTSGHTQGDPAKPPTSRAPIVYAIGAAALLVVVTAVAFAADRYSLGKTSAKPSGSAPAEPSVTATFPPKEEASNSAGLPSSPSPQPSASASSRVQVAVYPPSKGGPPIRPTPSAGPRPTPAQAPLAPSPSPPPPSQKVDCDPPIVTDPKTGEVRVKPGCR